MKKLLLLLLPLLLIAGVAGGVWWKYGRQRDPYALAQQLIVLCERGEHGIYHATCQGQTTWHGFATALCEESAALGITLKADFTAVSSSALPTVAPRPAMALLDPHMLRLRGLLRIPPWRDALRSYLHELIAAGQL